MAYKIIAGDPSLSVQRALQSALPEPEFRLFPFEDGAALLEAAAEIRPDAVLLGVALAGRDGYEVGRILRGREDFRRVPIVLLRGTFEALEGGPAVAPDFDEVFAKPFDSERLAASVRDLIEKKTTPATLPEDPVRMPSAPRPEPSASGPVPEEPAAAPAPASGTAPLHPNTGLRELLRREILGTEREIEKRVRAKVLADVKEWMAAGGPGPKGTV